MVAMEQQPPHSRPICSWEFGKMTGFPRNSASRGCSLIRQVGLELDGQQAHITLPFRLPEDVPKLRDRTMAVCVRFVNDGAEGLQTGLIAIGLDAPVLRQYERLVFGFEGTNFDHFPYWRVDNQLSSSEQREFAFLDSFPEDSSNEDVHLALIVEKTHGETSRGFHFKCYRNGDAYGEHATSDKIATFHRDSLSALVIKRPSGAGKILVKYAQLFRRALSLEDIKYLGKSLLHSYLIFASLGGRTAE